MSELDFACLRLQVALANKASVDRKIKSDSNRRDAIAQAWRSMSLTSTQKKRKVARQ